MLKTISDSALLQGLRVRKNKTSILTTTLLWISQVSNRTSIITSSIKSNCLESKCFYPKDGTETRSEVCRRTLAMHLRLLSQQIRMLTRIYYVICPNSKCFQQVIVRACSIKITNQYHLKMILVSHCNFNKNTFNKKH